MEPASVVVYLCLWGSRVWGDGSQKKGRKYFSLFFFLLRRVTAVIDGALHIWKIDENLKIYSKDFIHTTYLVVEMRNTFPALIFFQGQAPLPAVCFVVRGDDKSVFLMSSSPAFYRRKWTKDLLTDGSREVFPPLFLDVRIILHWQWCAKLLRCSSILLCHFYFFL